MQRSGFTMPILLVTPSMLFLLKILCYSRKADLCNLSFLPKEVFWNCNDNEIKFDFFYLKLNYQFFYCIMWLFPLIWFTIHLWMPKQKRLARSEE